VTSILSNPDDDPHLFEGPAPRTAKALSDAKNRPSANGVDYDPWMEKLAWRQQRRGPQEIVVVRWSVPQGPATIRICGTILHT